MSSDCSNYVNGANHDDEDKTIVSSNKGSRGRISSSSSSSSSSTSSSSGSGSGSTSSIVEEPCRVGDRKSNASGLSVEGVLKGRIIERATVVKQRQQIRLKPMIAKDKLCDEDLDALVVETSHKISLLKELPTTHKTEEDGEKEETTTGSQITTTRSSLNDQFQSSINKSSGQVLESDHLDDMAVVGYNRLNQPKRPMNAFMVWGQAIRRELHHRFSNVQNALLSKALGRVWRSLGAGEKEFYIRRANLIKANHKRDYPNYRYQPRRVQERRARNNMLIGINLNHPINHQCPRQYQLQQQQQQQQQYQAATTTFGLVGTNPVARSMILRDQHHHSQLDFSKAGGGGGGVGGGGGGGGGGGKSMVIHNQSFVGRELLRMSEHHISSNPYNHHHQGTSFSSSKGAIAKDEIDCGLRNYDYQTFPVRQTESLVATMMSVEGLSQTLGTTTGGNVNQNTSAAMGGYRKNCSTSNFVADCYQQDFQNHHQHQQAYQQHSQVDVLATGSKQQLADIVYQPYQQFNYGVAQHHHQQQQQHHHHQQHQYHPHQQIVYSEMNNQATSSFSDNRCSPTTTMSMGNNYFSTIHNE